MKPDTNNPSVDALDGPGEDDVSVSIKQIRLLENQLIALRRKLLFSEDASSMKSTASESGFLLMRTGDRILAIPLVYVDEVVEMPMLMPLPRTIPSVMGLINYHGRMIAVIDMMELSGLTSETSPLDQMLVICTVESRTFALKTDEALDVVSLSAKNVTMTDAVLPGILKTSGLLHIEGSEPAVIIDPEWISTGAHLGACLNEDAATPTHE